ncbi:MAG: hypothetical protein OEV94_01850 [Deltaproteobacteria bacterium]|nr:hypothetical protein [Deltaproteobacteria bacterium]
MTPTQPSRSLSAEIFSVGTWNGQTFTRQDLEELAANFERLKDELKPPLKFGHDPAQPVSAPTSVRQAAVGQTPAGATLTGQADGDPSLGWVERLWVAGDKLMASFTHMPEVVWQAISQGRYRRVSAEIYTQVRQNGQSLGKALKAVALLGADLPAVTNLQDLAVYLTPPPSSTDWGLVQTFTWAVTHGPEQTPPTEARAFHAQGEPDHHQAVLTFARQAVGEGKLPPYLFQQLAAEMNNPSASFSEQDSPRVSWAWVREFLSGAVPRLPAGEQGAARSAAAFTGEDEDPSQRLARLASARMSAEHLSYSQAAELVLKTDPELAQAYRDYTLTAHWGA